MQLCQVTLTLQLRLLPCGVQQLGGKPDSNIGKSLDTWCSCFRGFIIRPQTNYWCQLQTKMLKCYPIEGLFCSLMGLLFHLKGLLPRESAFRPLVESNCKHHVETVVMKWYEPHLLLIPFQWLHEDPNSPHICRRHCGFQHLSDVGIGMPKLKPGGDEKDTTGFVF